jgi:hypothetical protein
MATSLAVTAGHPLAPVSVLEQDALSRLAAALAVALIQADVTKGAKRRGTG